MGGCYRAEFVSSTGAQLVRPAITQSCTVEVSRSTWMRSHAATTSSKTTPSPMRAPRRSSGTSFCWGSSAMRSLWLARSPKGEMSLRCNGRKTQNGSGRAPSGGEAALRVVRLDGLLHRQVRCNDTCSDLGDLIQQAEDRSIALQAAVPVGSLITSNNTFSPLTAGRVFNLLVSRRINR